MGKKRQPIYKIVVADSRSPRDGKFIEAVGLYNPKANPHIVEINEDRALYWLNVGAQPTDTVNSLLSHQGILLKRELTKQGKSPEEIEAEMTKWNSSKKTTLTPKGKKSVVESQKIENTTEDKGAASEVKPE